MEDSYVVLIIAAMVLVPIPIFIAYVRNLMRKWVVWVTSLFSACFVAGYHIDEWWGYLPGLAWFVALAFSIFGKATDEKPKEGVLADTDATGEIPDRQFETTTTTETFSEELANVNMRLFQLEQDISSIARLNQVRTGNLVSLGNKMTGNVNWKDKPLEFDEQAATHLQELGNLNQTVISILPSELSTNLKDLLESLSKITVDTLVHYMKTTQELAEIIKRSEFMNDEESRCNLIQLSNFVESSRDKLNEFHARARGLANIVGLLTILMMRTNALVPDDLLIFDLHFWNKLDALKDKLMEGLAGITSRIQQEVDILDEVDEQQRENIRIGRECEQEARGYVRNARPEQMWPNATADIFGGDIDILAHGGDMWGLALIECKAGSGKVIPNPAIPNGIIVNADRTPNPNHDRAFWQVANRTSILESYCNVHIQPILCVCSQENAAFDHGFEVNGKTYQIKVCSARVLRSVLREIPPIPDSDWKGCLVELLGQPGDNGNIDWSRQD